jgi:hypothetical protein
MLWLYATNAVPFGNEAVVIANGWAMDELPPQLVKRNDVRNRPAEEEM